MAKLISGRVPKLNVGITSFSEDQSVLNVVGGAYITGITTLAAQGGITTTGGDLYVGRDLYVNDDIVFDEVTARGITVTGYISAGSTTGVLDQYLKSTGVGVTWATFPTLRTENNFTATSGQTSFTVSYTVGFVDVYVNGVRLTTSEYTATNGTSIVLSEACFGGEAVDILAYNTTSTSGSGGGSGSGISTEYQTLNDVLGLGNTSTRGMSVGVVTATSFIGNLTGTATTATTAGYATTAGISTVAQGLSGTPNVSVGIITVTDSRLQSVSEKSTVISGNTVSLVYNTGGGNVAICTNPTGAITLNVTGVPTDSSFDNRTLNFTVIVIQSTTGYACTTINLNGVSRTVKYPGGVVSVASTSSYDIFNFTAINTVGSASTTTNYQILGMINGNFK